MEEWIAPSQLAQENKTGGPLPGIPRYRNKLNDIARQNWDWRPAQGRSGERGPRGIEIRVASLPEETRAERLRRSLSAAADGVLDGVRRPPPKPHFQLEAAAGSSDRKKPDDATRRWRRASAKQKQGARLMLQAVETVAGIAAQDERRRREGEPPIGLMASYKIAAERVFGTPKRAKRVEAAYAKVRNLPRAQWVMALVDRRGESKSPSLIDQDPELQKAILGAAIYSPSSPRMTIPKILVKVKELLPDRKPSQGQVRRFLSRWKRENYSLWLALTNPKAFNDRCLTAIGKLADGVDRPNQRIVADFSPADIVLLKEGRTVRIGACKDRFTRETQLRACDGGPSAEDTAEMYIRWTLTHGYVETLETDRGKEFLNALIERGLADMGTNHVVNDPYSGWQKGDVERAIGAVQTRIANLAGYCGPNVAVRQELRERLAMADRRGLDDREVLGVQLTFDEFKLKLQEIERDINDSVHRDLGMSPNQFRARFKGPVQRFDDELTLRMVFGKGGFRVVKKEGVNYEGIWFWHVDLIPFIGRRVFVVETGDMGLLMVLTENRGEEIAVAVNLDRVGKARRDMAILARTAQRRFVKEGRAALRSVRAKIKAGVVADAITEVRADSPLPTTALLPKYPTPQAAAAAVAARALHAAAADLSRGSSPAIATQAAEVEAAEHPPTSRTAELLAEWSRLTALPASERSPHDNKKLRGIEASYEFQAARRWGKVA